MNTKKFLLMSALVASLASCNESKETVATGEATAVEQTASELTYGIDSNSTLGWEGFKLASSHKGLFVAKEGQFNVNAGKVVSGSIVFDMTSLKITDGTTDPKLPGHLKGGDFFNVDTFPKAQFTITEIKPGTGDSSLVTGNLELKSVSKSVTFPALVVVNENEVTAKANFFIDRTVWNLSYGNDKSLGDYFIKPEVGINFDIKATKK